MAETMGGSVRKARIFIWPPQAGPSPPPVPHCLLALRDQAITALSQWSPEGASILAELANLHLALAYPKLKARTPPPPSEESGVDTLAGVPRAPQR